MTDSFAKTDLRPKRLQICLLTTVVIVTNVVSGKRRINHILDNQLHSLAKVSYLVIYLIYELSKQIPYGSTDFKNAKDQMKKKIKNIMKYSNERFNKEGPRKFRKNNQRKSKVIIPKEAYAHLKSQYKKIL